MDINKFVTTEQENMAGNVAEAIYAAYEMGLGLGRLEGLDLAQIIQAEDYGQEDDGSRCGNPHCVCNWDTETDPFEVLQDPLDMLQARVEALEEYAGLKFVG